VLADDLDDVGRSSQLGEDRIGDVEITHRSLLGFKVRGSKFPGETSNLEL
jgi:hypothetical protein